MSDAMVKTAIRQIWKLLPPALRLRAVRMTQRKFTASAAAVVINPKNEVLLLDHVLRPFSSWGLPGGLIGRAEQPAEAIEREVSEEVGIVITAVELYRIRTVDRHIEILFTARSDGTPQIRSREIIDAGWFAVDRLPDGISRSQRSMIVEVLGRPV
jgi:8-oxo-dGTP pyrophosphatase MutT (NUDIX family)